MSCGYNIFSSGLSLHKQICARIHRQMCSSRACSGSLKEHNTAKNPGLRLGCLSFKCCDLHTNNPLLALVLQLCNKPIQNNWISVQSVVKFICLLQVGAICLQYSHDDVIGKPNIHLCCWNLSYNNRVSAVA